MMNCPNGHCLCRTLQAESARIWNDLQDAEKFNSPIHEDTITQTMSLTLNRQHAAENKVHIFGRSEEKKNGSDFIWLLFNGNFSRHFRVTVQAKRLYPDGSYAAFKKLQASKMKTFAVSINAMPIYAFYNYYPFRKAYYYSRIFRGWRRHTTIGLDYARDFGAIYVPTDEILKIGKPTLTARDIAGKFKPLWYPFCHCVLPAAPDQLDRLSAVFSEGLDLPDTERAVPSEADQGFIDWMQGRPIEEGRLEDLLRINPERVVEPDEAFQPSFVVGTRLPIGEGL